MITAPSTVHYAKRLVIGVSVSTVLCSYVAYRNHDGRTLSNEEVAAARKMLAQITPSTQPSSTAESSLQQHMHNLNKLGVTVIEDVLCASELQTWNAKSKAAFDNTDGKKHNIVWNAGRAHCSISKRSIYYEDMSRVGEESNANRTCAETQDESLYYESFTWLNKLFLRNNEHESEQHHLRKNHPTKVQKMITLKDIVESYFSQQNITRYELTDVQFLNACPASTNQIWHCDNKFKGLTVIVALKDIDDNGPTELILGSHSSDYTLSSKYKMAVGKYMSRFLIDTADESSKDGEIISIPTKPLLACINAGDAVLYDARIFHRGRGNNGRYDTDRPVLVLRWDAARTPPPGTGLIVTTANIYWGKVLYACLYLLEKLQQGKP
eukprot:scaffold41156_cov78-Cyclotella_meneghiniana.AAC.3